MYMRVHVRVCVCMCEVAGTVTYPSGDDGSRHRRQSTSVISSADVPAG